MCLKSENDCFSYDSSKYLFHHKVKAAPVSIFILAQTRLMLHIVKQATDFDKPSKNYHELCSSIDLLAYFG